MTARARGVLQTAQLFRIIDRCALAMPFCDQWYIYTAFVDPHSRLHMPRKGFPQ